LYYNSITHYPQLKSLAVNTKFITKLNDLPTTFDQYSGIPLYWNLGMKISE
jgi:hypothetical protein